MSLVVAHAGGTGWDEVLLTLAPLAASVAVFAALRRRQRAFERSER